MSKICMVEYQGRCDEAGKSVGHAPKVLAEYYEIIKDNNEVSIIAPKNILQDTLDAMYIDEMSEKNGKRRRPSITRSMKIMPHSIVMKTNTEFVEKIINKFKMFNNIRLALKFADGDTIWFFNTEYYLMLYLFLHKKPEKKIICTMFLDGYHGNIISMIKQWIFNQAQKKMDYIISSGRNFEFKNCSSIYIPDYLYDDSKYEGYRKLEKKDRAVCIGTMGKGKQLEEMVRAFTKCGYPLLIAGRFYSVEEAEALKKIAGNNVMIRNEYLSDDEYRRILGGSKYVVIPYDPKQYATQTSGVLQEAVFMDAVPVTYGSILKAAEISGVGFESWDEISLDIFSGDTEIILSEFERIRNEEYSKEKMIALYKEVFSE